jgi:biotin carboxyl carrier protein
MAIKHYSINTTTYETSCKDDTFSINDKTFTPELKALSRGSITLNCNNQIYTATIEQIGAEKIVTINNRRICITRILGSNERNNEAQAQGNNLAAPLAGRVIKSFISASQAVKKNDLLITIESMKMENEIRASRNGFIKTVSFKEGDLVKANQVLITFND